MMVEQFFHLASSTRESGTFSSHPEVNLKGHASRSSGVNTSESVRKVDAATSLRSDQEINNQVGNSNEPSRFLPKFFSFFFFSRNQFI